MQYISSTELKNQLGQYLNLTNSEPITVNKSGKPIAVMLSPAEYEHLQQMEDLYWIARADAMRDSGEWVSGDEAIKILTQKLGTRT